MNYRMISYTLGWILLFESAFLLVPTATAIIYGEYSVMIAFLISIGICLLAGFPFMVIKPKNTVLRARDGFVIVAFSWILLSLFGAIPFMLTGVTNNYIDALFETASGLTTTGATIFGDVESLPRAIIIWRSFTHWIGGMGILVFVMAFLPLSGGTNLYIMKAESPGPSVTKPVPKIKTTAKLLYIVYLVLTAILIVILISCGVGVFNSLNIAFSTAGTGGFGFFNDSMASYPPHIQIIVGIFMLLFSLNFSSYFLLLRGRIKEAITTEIKVFVAIVAAAVAMITLNLRLSGIVGSTSDALRHSFFTVSSVISTTGFSTEDFGLWPALSQTVIIIVMFIGACAGSTGGGIKVSRIIVMFKLMARELGTALHPKQVKKISVDNEIVDKNVLRSIYSFFFAYITVFIISVVILSFDGHDIVTNFTSVLTTIGNVGPGLSKVGPSGNYAFFSPLSKIVLILDMLAGRLELFPLLLLFVPSTWRK